MTEKASKKQLITSLSFVALHLVAMLLSLFSKEYIATEKELSARAVLLLWNTGGLFVCLLQLNTQLDNFVYWEQIVTGAYDSALIMTVGTVLIHSFLFPRALFEYSDALINCSNAYYHLIIVPSTQLPPPSVIATSWLLAWAVYVISKSLGRLLVQA